MPLVHSEKHAMIFYSFHLLLSFRRATVQKAAAVIGTRTNRTIAHNKWAQIAVIMAHFHLWYVYYSKSVENCYFQIEIK